MINIITRAWNKAKQKKEFWDGHKVKFAFSIDGKDYYQFENDLDIPEKRFAFARHYFHEMEMRMTKELLLEFLDAGLNCLKPKTGEPVELGKLNTILTEMKDRTEWLTEPDSILRMASVLYFTLDENVYDYDEAYAAKKIELFKKKGLTMYFTKILATESNGLLSMSLEDIKTYLDETEKMTEAQRQFLNKKKG